MTVPHKVTHKKQSILPLYPYPFALGVVVQWLRVWTRRGCELESCTILTIKAPSVRRVTENHLINSASLGSLSSTLSSFQNEYHATCKLFERNGTRNSTGSITITLHCREQIHYSWILNCQITFDFTLLIVIDRDYDRMMNDFMISNYED